MSSTQTEGQPKKKVETQQDVALRKALEQLRKIGGLFYTEDEIERGPKLIVPHSMSLKQVRDYLKQYEERQGERLTISRQFKYRAKDGAVATWEALNEAFGTVVHKGTGGFFATPPEMIDVAVGFGQNRQIPWGALEVPAIPETTLYLGRADDVDLGPVFAITVDTLKRYQAEVEGLLKLIEDQLKNSSIYRGQAIDASFAYLDLSQVEAGKVVYSEEVYRQIEASILVPIRFPEQVKAAGVSGKSAVLLAGTYGVGKTLCAYITAQECVRQGRTFIQVRPNRDDLERAMQTARMYAPAVVFFEDVDTIASADGATEHVSGLLEMFDGVRAKGVDVMGIFTTNHIEQIHKGMLRPGRFDAVIEIGAPDGAGIIKLCKTIVPAELLEEPEDEADWAQVAVAMKGYLPAFVAEACGRAAKYALARTNGESAKLTVEDLAGAGEELRAQYDLMQGARDLRQKDALDDVFRKAMSEVVQEETEEVVLNMIPEFLLPDWARDTLNQRRLEREGN